jgi:hypothetical protein
MKNDRNMKWKERETGYSVIVFEKKRDKIRGLKKREDI